MTRFHRYSVSHGFWRRGDDWKPKPAAKRAAKVDRFDWETGEFRKPEILPEKPKSREWKTIGERLSKCKSTSALFYVLTGFNAAGDVVERIRKMKAFFEFSRERACSRARWR